MRRSKLVSAVSSLVVVASVAMISPSAARAASSDPLAGVAMQARDSLDAVTTAQSYVNAAAYTAAVADTLAARADVLDATAAAVTSARRIGLTANAGTQAAVDSLARHARVLKHELSVVSVEQLAMGDVDAQVAAARTALSVTQTTYADDLEGVAIIVADRTGVDPARLMTAWQTTTAVRAYVVLSAMAQAGDPYRYASVGPDYFDCSGLTTWSWAQAGVTLTSQSAAQERATDDISWDEAQVGDLVFKRGGSGTGRVHHVELWLGVDQLAVGTTQPGKPVRVTDDPPRIDVIGAVVTPENWRT